MKHRKTAWILTSIFIVAILLRVVLPSADPPVWLDDDLGLFADEGYKTLAAKNTVLYGDVKTNELDSYAGWSKQSPLSTLGFKIAFELFGVGFVPARIVNIFYSIISLGLFYWLIRKLEGEKFAILATGALGLNFLYLVYSKIALLEVQVTFYLILSTYFWVKAEEYPWWMAASFACWVMAYLVKPIAIFFAPVIFYMLYDTVLRRYGKKGLAGTAVTTAAVILFMSLLFPDLPSRMLTLLANRTPETIGTVILNLRRFWSEEYLLINGLLYIGFFGYLMLMMSKLRGSGSKVSRQEWVFLVWTLSMFALLILQFYRPIRYFIPLTPAFIYLAVKFVTERKEFSKALQNKDKVRKYLQIGVLFFGLEILFANLYFPMRNHLFEGLKAMKAEYFVITFVLSIVLAWGIYKGISYIRLSNKAGKDVILGTVVIVYLLANLIPVAIWYAAPSYSLIESSRDAGSIIPEGASVLGINWPQALCMENKNKCYIVTEGFNEENEVFRALEIDYFVSDDIHNPDYDVEFLKNPKFEQSIESVKEYKIGRVDVTLYKFHPEIFHS